MPKLRTLLITVIMFLVVLNLSSAFILGPKVGSTKQQYVLGEDFMVTFYFHPDRKDVYYANMHLEKDGTVLTDDQSKFKTKKEKVLDFKYRPETNGKYSLKLIITDKSGATVEDITIDFEVLSIKGNPSNDIDELVNDPCQHKCYDNDAYSENPLLSRSSVKFLRSFGDQMIEDSKPDQCVGSSKISESSCDQECKGVSEVLDCPGNTLCAHSWMLKYDPDDTQYGAACVDPLENVVVKVNDNLLSLGSGETLQISDQDLSFSVELAEQASGVNVGLNPKGTSRLFGTSLTKNEDAWTGEISTAQLGAGEYDVWVSADFDGKSKVRLNMDEKADIQIFKPYKVLFVAANWGGTNQEFTEEVQGQFDAFVNSYPIKDCASQAQMFMITPDQLNCDINFGPSITIGGPSAIISLLDCIFKAKDNFPGIINTDLSSQLGLTQDNNNFQVVTAMIDKDPYPCVRGFFPGFNTVFVQKGDKMILAHEIGHVFSLREEYIYAPTISSTPWNIRSGTPNELSAEYGCDPTPGNGCCGPLGACATPEGQAQCAERRDKLLSGNYQCGDDPENPCWSQPGSRCGCDDYAACCLGNLNRFDPNNIGRSIMSSVGAPVPRGFSEPAWQHLLKQPEFQCKT